MNTHGTNAGTTTCVLIGRPLKVQVSVESECDNDEREWLALPGAEGGITGDVTVGQERLGDGLGGKHRSRGRTMSSGLGKAFGKLFNRGS